MVLVALYETQLHHIAPDLAIDGLIEVFRHNWEHYSKITASLLPILSMLTTGKLADSLSPSITDPHDTRPVMNLEKVINGGHVLYIGLDSMPNPTVASTLAGIWLADLANIAGRRYNLGLSALNSKRISLFIDEDRHGVFEFKYVHSSSEVDGLVKEAIDQTQSRRYGEKTDRKELQANITLSFLFFFVCTPCGQTISKKL